MPRKLRLGRTGDKHLKKKAKVEDKTAGEQPPVGAVASTAAAAGCAAALSDSEVDDDDGVSVCTEEIEEEMHRESALQAAWMDAACKHNAVAFALRHMPDEQSLIARRGPFRVWWEAAKALEVHYGSVLGADEVVQCDCCQMSEFRCLCMWKWCERCKLPVPCSGGKPLWHRQVCSCRIWGVNWPANISNFETA